MAVTSVASALSVGSAIGGGLRVCIWGRNQLEPAGVQARWGGAYRAQAGGDTCGLRVQTANKSVARAGHGARALLYEVGAHWPAMVAIVMHVSPRPGALVYVSVSISF